MYDNEQDDNASCGYDSDCDPSEIVGQRVCVKWPVGQGWFEGVCDEYDKSTGRHHIRYDDGDQRWYFLAEKIFRVLND